MTWRAPVAVAEAARLGLRLRAALPPSLRGGTAIGLRRAVQLANRQPMWSASAKRPLRSNHAAMRRIVAAALACWRRLVAMLRRRWSRLG